MLTFRDMTLDDRDTVLPMVDAFYRSNAVDHPVPREIVERSFLAAAGNEPLLRGTLIGWRAICMSPCVTPRRWAGPASSLRRSISCRSSVAAA